ncbi:type VI secretion system-associated protein TagO [Thioclava atlantica]|uniref:Uncharacterized protein n=1 Tax=Thioclava atlantica TaxID=1317124 RepID=A0A085TZU2_9RHOB|nr:type VI secretion system-associated protein TagO [Thioclava atlantica]KFE36239.1 hypothetical protein DW2_02984 [Thioclava atlantica]
MIRPLALWMMMLAGLGQPAVTERPDTPSADRAADRTGGWSLRDVTDSLDDSRAMSLSLRAVGGTNTFGDAPTLIAFCNGEVSELFVDWGEFVGFDGIALSVSLGRTPARTQLWKASYNGSATFLPDRVEAQLNAIAQVRHLVIETTPPHGHPIRAVFETHGLAEMLPQFAAQCHWNGPAVPKSRQGADRMVLSPAMPLPVTARETS